MGESYYTNVNGYGQFTTIQTRNNMNTGTRVVRLKAGFVGQVIYSDGDVLWESKPKKTQEKAFAAAQKALKQGVEDLFNYLPGQV